MAGDHDGHIVAPAAEIAVQKAREEAGMTNPDPRVRVDAPVAPQTIRVHDRDGIACEGVVEFLYTGGLVPCRAIVGHEALTSACGSPDGATGVAEPRIAGHAPLQIDGE